MRNVIALAGLAVMAAVVVLGDGGHPYQYETSAGWGDHHHNALVSSRQSPNPLRSRQALAALLTPGVLTAIASFAGAIGVGTVQTTAVNNRVDETNRRVGTNENDIKKSKADIKTLTDNSCTKTTCNDIKSTADGACTTAKCTAIETAATALTTRVMAAETAVTNTETFVKNTCNKVNEILAITAPEGLAMNQAKNMLGNVDITPGSNPASKALGTNDGTGTNAYQLTKCVAATGNPSAEGDGLGYASGVACVAPAAGGTDTEALTVTDFNLFRLRVVDALNTFENKFRQLTNTITDLTCPT